MGQEEAISHSSLRLLRAVVVLRLGWFDKQVVHEECQ